MNIPNITSDKILVEIIDKLKHRLRVNCFYSKLTYDFNNVLNQFIEKHNLGIDQYCNLKRCFYCDSIKTSVKYISE